MSFCDGFLALCSAASVGNVSEISVPGYARQPISFSIPKNGTCTSARPWNFGFCKPSQIVARAVYDGPTAGNLLLILPFFSVRPTPGLGPCDAGDVGDIVCTFTALQNYPDGAAFSGSLAAGSAIGSVYDKADIVGPIVSGGNYQLITNSSTLSSGVQLAINRGALVAHGVFVS